MSILKSIFGIIYAEENAKDIVLRGVKVKTISRDLMRIWSTSKIEQYMFSKFRYDVISFPKFFAPEVHYILRQLLTGKYMTTSKGIVRKALAALEENTWLAGLEQEPVKILDRTKANLFKFNALEHQARFFDVFEDIVTRYQLNGYLLSAAPGAGKTFTSLLLAEMLHASTVVLVVPKNSQYTVWNQHLKEVYKEPQDAWIAIEGKDYTGQRFIITHYEGLEDTLAVCGRFNNANTVVVLDESHNFNEIDSKRTQLFVELCKRVKSKYTLWSSGTPIKALGYESIPLLRTIDKYFTPDVEFRFKKIFGRDAKRALDILKNRMGIISYKVEKNEFVDNKPSTENISIKIPNGDKYTLEVVGQVMTDYIKKNLKYYLDNMKHFEAIYNQAMKEHEKYLKDRGSKEDYKQYQEYIKEIRRGFDPRTMSHMSMYCNNYENTQIIPNLSKDLKAPFKNARAVVKYPQLKVLGEALGNVLAKKREECQIELALHSKLEDVVDKAVKKTVIFTSYVGVVKELEKYFKAKGYNPLVVYGETNKELPNIVKQFEVDAKADPLIATYKSLSTAVPLIMADQAVFTNMPWRDYELTQAKARIDRLGQDTPVKFVFTTLDTGDKPNLSTRSSDILAWSKEQIAAIMGDSYSDADASVINSTLSMESFTDADIVNENDDTDGYTMK